MKTHLSVSLLLALCAVRFSAGAQSIYTYAASWPTNHLAGTFTLQFGPALGLYTSTAAQGAYGNPDGSQTAWADVRFWSQPNFAELYFDGQNGFARTFDTYPPTSNGRYVSWTSASEAWEALLTAGAAEGVTISVVPEPAGAVLLGAACFSAMVFRRLRVRFPDQNTSRLCGFAFKNRWPQLRYESRKVAKSQSGGNATEEDNRMTGWEMEKTITQRRGAKILTQRRKERKESQTWQSCKRTGREMEKTLNLELLNN